MKIPRIDLNTGVSKINKKNIECKKTAYENTELAKTPQMGLVSFSGNRAEAVVDLMKGVREVAKTKVKWYLLEWENDTTNPSDKRVQELSDAISGLAVLAQKQTKSPLIKNSLKTINKLGTEGLNDIHKGVVREWNEAIDVATKLPSKFVREQSKLKTKANKVWEKAREKNDFKMFEPYLLKTFITAKKGANYIDSTKLPLDVMLEDIGYTTKEVDRVFTELKKDLVPLAKEIAAKAKINKEILDKPVDIKQLQDFAIEIGSDMGLDMSKITLGKTAHSFMSGIDSPKDIRLAISQPNTEVITVAEALDILSSFTHEAGHGLVEQGASMKLHRTGLAEQTLGIHESQSRLWENIVGRSKGFWQHKYPQMQDKVHGFKDIKFEDFYNAMNYVEPSLIRTQADEVTYNLHIMLRHEIEKELLNSELNDQELAKLVAKLPETWNSKMEEYLGLKPPTDKQGVLQDVHWSDALIGYFPSYAIGNLAGAQFINTAKKEIPDLEEQIAKGNLKPLSNWLKEKIYVHGKTYKPDEIVQRVTGEPLNPKYFIEYLKTKYLG